MSKEIFIKNQKEFDALPESFSEYTYVYIRDTTERIIVARAWENSSVVAWGNSSVVAWENSSVVAWGNSSVVARGNSSVEAWENSSVRLFSEWVKIILHGFSVAFLSVTLKLNIAIKKESKYVHIQKFKDLGWFERNSVKKTPKIIVYKRVSSDFKTQEGNPNETLWAVGSVVTHPKWEPEKSECGEGKFHACSRPYFCDEFRSKKGDKYIAIEVASKDLYEWKKNYDYLHKIGFRAGKVLYQCDRMGKEIKA